MADNPRIEELRRRVQSDPASIAFAALAEEYRRAGQYEDAIATCKAGLQRHPAYLSAHVTLGRALIEVKRFDEAREQLEYVLKVAPENLAAIRALAEIHDRRNTEVEHGKAKMSSPADSPQVAKEPSQEPAVPSVSPAPPGPPLTLVQPLRVSPAPAASEETPELVKLERFLAAIVRARQELETASSSAR